MRTYEKLYINGEWTTPNGKATSEVINPATNAVTTRVPAGDESDVDRAVLAARAAFPSWSQTTTKERAELMRALADKLDERKEELEQVMVDELGMPIQLADDYQVSGPIESIRGFANRCEELDRVEEINNSLIYQEPVGVCAFINPWNYPMHQMIGKVAPALAAGCTMVVKAASQTPSHAFIMAEAIHAVGFPAGVFNLVHGSGRIIGEAMCRHPEVDMVSFTGSTGAGIRIAELAAPSIKRVCQELGGKSPFIITADADLKTAVEFGVDEVMANSGQTCSALTRMLVPESRYDEAVEIAQKFAEGLCIGDPTDPKSFMGPMSSEDQRQTVLEYIQKGIDEGARLVTGGTQRPEGLETGAYVLPTIFADVTNDMVIAREEIFGPVLTMIKYSDEAEAIRIANDTEFGLSSAVWAKDKESGLKIARQIRAGQVYVNGGAYNFDAPFGGYKQSGNGREWGGHHGLSEFLETKAIQM
ncbi:MAG: aldehyde dehydrogenase family protein [Myxococcales bacterium]|nr:aldehyde dehydrogenase family protein [Myxococcales bacterium]MCH7868624.1 aldehyde dehydrogenase family protein [Myxococcales bacterium]